MVGPPQKTFTANRDVAMHHKTLAVLLFCMLAFAQCAPGGRSFNPTCMMAEVENCDINDDPVCGIDPAGVVQTFENRCMALSESCRRGTLFVEMKPGRC